MKLVLAVVQDADTSGLMQSFAEHSFEVTKLASTGGFLREGNTTLMIGVENERLDELKGLIKSVCQSRTRLVAPSVALGEQHEGLVADPVEVAVGGSVLFVLDVQEFVKF